MLPAPIPSAVDLQGFADLRQRAAREDPAALAEIAVQFEALFIGMMLDSARNASLGDGIFDGAETRQYLELMDQQVALDLARKGGFGFSKLLVEQLTQRALPPIDSPRAPLAHDTSIQSPAHGQGPAPVPTAVFPSGLPPSLATLGRTAVVDDEKTTAPASQRVDAPESADERVSTPEDFVARFLPEATTAAKALGVEPRLLLAQAALETGWGGAGALQTEGRSANNLFGIKAGAAWRGARSAQWTIEHRDGVAERKREEFRAYPSTAASFADYVDLISSAPRYTSALERAHDPEAYARAVTAAGYATDPDYAEKWLSIYHGDRLDGALRGLKPAEVEPTK
jgi:flagellar protein FlgJ